MLRKIGFFAIVISAVMLVSCGNEEEKEVKATQEATKINEGKMVEKIADATTWDPSWKTANTVIYHILGEPNDMHPTNGLSAMRQEITLYTQVYLMNTDLPNLNLMPQLAASMPEISANELEYTYTLNDYMKWDDGSLITPEDVVFTYKVNKCPLVNNPHAKPYLEMIKEVVVIAPNKIKMVMAQKYIQNASISTDYVILQRSFWDPANVLAKYSFQQFNDPKFVADKNEDLKKWSADFNSNDNGHKIDRLAGAGPYYIEKWDVGQSITLAKKKNHWSEGRTGLYEMANPEKIIFKVNQDANSIKNDFLNQVFDVTGSVDIGVLLDLQKDSLFNKNYNARFMNTYNFTYVGMNMKPDGVKHKKIFDDVKVRKAMAMLIPYDNINKIANKGVYERIVGPVSPMKPEYNKDLKLIEMDVEAASKLLAEAGWKDSDGDQVLDKLIDGKKTDFKFRFNYMATSPAWETSAKLIAENMQKAKIVVELEKLQLNVFIEHVHSHDFDMMIMPLSGTSVPEDFKQVWHTESWLNNGSNYFGFGNAKSDALIEKIRITLDEAEHTRLVKELQQIIYDEQPCVFMYAQKRRIVVHKRFGNQEFYFDKPGVLLNRLKLIPAKQ
ncbi:MAG: extracellular solute-binding protein [Bacteroidetes bacterium]|nr:extracellular solute-binding protein [Bacteroidota bacterium]